jgi:pyruvate dehydrogenase (quinone)
MTKTVRQLIADRLHAWGVRRAFGDAAMFGNAKELELVHPRQEEMAAFMACAHAKLTGEVGVCVATSTHGAIHLLSGLYDARMDHQPVVAVVDDQREADLASLFKDVAREDVQTLVEPHEVRHVVDRAMRNAKSRRTVTCIVVPHDLEESAVEEPGVARVAFSRPHVVPNEHDLRNAARILNEGKRIAMLVGAGALDATGEVIAAADRLGAGCAKSLLGLAVVPDDLSWVTGAIGPMGTKPSADMMKDCDTLLVVGSSFPYTEHLPKRARGVQIDLDPTMLGLHQPMEANLVGDAGDTLRALVPLLASKRDPSWREKIRESVLAWRSDMGTRPEPLFRELSSRLPDGAILAFDPGIVASFVARDVRLRRGMMACVSGSLASIGSAVPYAIAAKLAHPERPVIACVDGRAPMSGIAELAMIVARRAEHAPFVVVVVGGEGSDVAAGVRAIHVGSDADIPAALDEAFAEDAGGPCVVDVTRAPPRPKATARSVFAALFPKHA